MKNTKLITKDVVDHAKPPKSGQAFIRDSRIQGFGLRIVETGAKSFIWEGRIKGRVRRITIGRYPDMSVALARAEAENIRGDIAKKLDPADERKKERGEITFRDLAKLYLDQHAKPHKDSWKSDEKRIDRHLNPKIGSRRISDVSTDDLARMQLNIKDGSGPYESNRTIVLARAIFNFAIARRLYTLPNPAKAFSLYREEKRERFLSPEELKCVNDALAKEPNIYWRSYFPLMLLLGMRRQELLSARWADVDLMENVLRIPDTKNDRPHLLPLPDAAVAILSALPSRGKSKWVFPGVGKTGHLNEPKKAWQRIRTAAKVPDCRIHDLRRTLGSWLASSGTGLPMIGRVLNHKSVTSTQVYARLELEGVRAALQKNADLMRLTTRSLPTLESSVEDQA